MLTFSEGLMHDLHQSSWESMNASEAGVLMWLSNLTLTNPHHIRLSEKVHATWDLAESNNQQFSIMNCIIITRTHWQKVRETMLKIGPRPGNSGVQRRPTTPLLTPQIHLKRKERKTRRGRRLPLMEWLLQPLKAQPFLHRHRRLLKGPPHRRTASCVGRRPTQSRIVRRWLETFGETTMWTHAITKRMPVHCEGRPTVLMSISG